MISPHFLIILGAGGHARSVADVASRLPWVRGLAFVDERTHAQGMHEMLGYKVYASLEDALPPRTASPLLHIAIGNSAVRARLAAEIAASHSDLRFISIIASSATIGLKAEIASGCFVGEYVHIGPQASIGEHSLINTHAVVEHDVRIGAFAHISVNATVAGTASIGEHCMLGAGSVVRDGIILGDHITLGAGAVAVGQITEAGRYVGIPARRMPEK